ncbi:MAG: GH25 family lysozyme [Myxococcales bacterium]
MRNGLFLLPACLVACGEGTPPHAYVGAAQSLGQAVTVCDAGTTLQGADVSSFQGTIDWATVAGTGLTFSIAKATEGVTIQDSSFAGNWSGMKANGIVRGAYHFFHSQDNGATQADDFLAQVSAAGGFQPGDLPPFLDWEATDTGTTNAQAIAGAQAFIDEIQTKTGLTTVIYTYPSFWSGLGNPSQFGSYPLWYANYVSPCPDIPSPWTDWLFWQTTSSGSVAGMNCSPSCDLDEFNGDLQQLQSIAVGGDGGIVINPPDGGTSGPDAGAALPATVLPQLSGNDAVTLVNWPDQHVSVFAKSPAGAILRSDTSGTGDGWSAPAQLATGAQCGSAASFWGGAWLYPELFSPLVAGGSGHLWWTAGSGWNGYQAYGGSGLSHLSTLVWPDGRTEVFALGSAGAAWHQYWDTATTAWSGWLSMGGTGFTQGPVGLVWADGHGELYEVDGSGGAWSSRSATGSGTDWTAFTQIGSGLASRLSPVRWPDGTVELFGRGQDGTVWRDTAQAGGTGFAGFSQLAAQATAGEPSAFVHPGAGAEIVTRDPAGQILDLAYSTSSGSWPASFVGLGQAAASDPFGWIRGDGAAEIFAVDGSGNLLHALESSGGGFGAFAAVGSGLDPCAAALPPFDGGTPDAGQPPADAGGSADAGAPATDAGKPDAGTSSDAGEAGDAGGTLGSGTPDAGGGGPAPEKAPGCGCTAAGGDALWPLAALLALALRRKR